MKKQVLIIGPGMEVGGVERSLLGLLDAIDYSQYDVDLFLLNHSGEFMPLINPRVNLLPEEPKLSLISEPIAKLIRERHFQVGAIRLLCKLYGDVRAKVKQTDSVSITLCKRILMKQLRPFQRKYDVALGFFAPHYLLTDKTEAKLKIGWVHTDYSNINEKPDTDFMQPMWSKLDYIACVSEDVERAFQTVYPSLAEKTIVVENILSPDFVRREAGSVDISAEMPAFDGVNILSVGRFCAAKAFDRIPEGCRILLDRGYQVKWYLIGYGPDEQLLMDKIREFHMEDTVIVLGKKTNPYPYMKACDIYAQPSRYEGKAVTVREAQMLHKPVMITRFETSASQVQEGVDGIICDNDVNGIADGIAYLIDRVDVREKLIENTERRDYGNTEELQKLWRLYEQR